VTTTDKLGIVAKLRRERVTRMYEGNYINPNGPEAAALIEELVGVLEDAREFIVNGVALGFIRMPDHDTPDKAHKTLPAIEAALAKVSPQ
jgi:hypothetical protein